MKKNENGRSMVEILGVLAIIGVLSISGIYGYTIAMRRYRANEIVQTASMLAVMAHAADSGKGECLDLDSVNLSDRPGGVNVQIVADGAIPDQTIPATVTINLVDEDPGDVMCDAIRNIAPYDCQSEQPISCSD